MSTDLRSGLSSMPRWQRRLLGAMVVLIVVSFALSIADTWGWLDGTKDTATLRPGDCVELPDGGRTYRELAVVTCDGPHDGEVIGILQADSLGRDTPTGACASALIGYADPERLALSELEPRRDTIALPIQGRKTTRITSYRCVADLRGVDAPPRSLRSET